MKCIIACCTLVTILSTDLKAQQSCDYQGLLKEADEAIKRREYEKAIYRLNSAIKCQPEMEKEVNEKILVVFEAVEIERKRAENANKQAQVKILEAEKARMEAEKARMEAERIQREALFSNGESALLVGDFLSAIQQFDLLIEIEPRSSRAYKYRGLANARLHNYDGAIADLSQSILISPNGTEAYYFRGFFYHETGDYMKAMEDYSKSILLDPSNPIPHLFRADLQRELGKYAEASADYDRAAALKIDLSKLEKDPNREMFLRAQFPFPPPLCRSPREIPGSVFNKPSKLGDIANRLSEVLEKQGYLYKSYLSVPNGFALVTQMERFNEDYSCIPGDNRWSNIPIGYSFEGFLNYFKQLILPEIAHYRTFVFVVTHTDFDSSNSKVAKSEAEAWFGKGINHLPRSVADQPFTDETKITALVYEFAVPESNRRPDQKCPYIDTQKHLEKSGIWGALSR